MSDHQGDGMSAATLIGVKRRVLCRILLDGRLCVEEEVPGNPSTSFWNLGRGRWMP